jgi:hypothetical protein
VALYWIGYDLDKPGQNYDQLIARLRNLSALRILKSDWLLGHNSTTTAQIRDDLARFIDSNDRLFVSQLRHQANWQNLLADDQTVIDLFKKYADS